MTKILVTGAQGLLGSTLVPHLRARGYEVLCHGRNGNVEFQGDLCDADYVSVVLDEVVPEVIVNLAALANVDECEQKPNEAYMANVGIVENLTRWIRKCGNENCHLIQISTDQVYDGPGLHKEGEVALKNYYAFSKYAGELVAATVSSTILRTNFIGPSLRPGRMSLSDWLIQALTRGDQITVFDDVRFSPLSLQRLVALVELAIAKRRQGVFNLGSKDGMSKADFAFRLADVLGLSTEQMRRSSSERVKLTAYRPKGMCMDSSRFEEAFGVQLPTLKEEIQSIKGAYADKTR